MSNYKRSYGFTLIELMIVVVIIAIIVGIAVPNYQGYMEQARRADGQAALLELANALERNFTVTGRYNALPGGPVISTDVVVVAFINALVGSNTVGEGNTYYTLTFGDADGNVIPMRTTYTIRAVPTGVQANDRCGVLSLSSAGVRGAADDNCWR